ncbi:MAG: hypothetical protein H0W56_09035, partial [Acidothermales bacterium]|nr:hypothetical protein [Acidothermales bacterium]
MNADAEGRGHDLRLVPAAAAAWLAAAVGVSLSGGRAVALAGLLGAVAVAAVATAWLMSRSLVRAGGDSSAARGWSSAQQLLRRPGPLHLLAAAACCA